VFRYEIPPSAANATSAMAMLGMANLPTLHFI
jgi:hypothetical protein